MSTAAFKKSIASLLGKGSQSSSRHTTKPHEDKHRQYPESDHNKETRKIKRGSETSPGISQQRRSVRRRSSQSSESMQEKQASQDGAPLPSSVPREQDLDSPVGSIVSKEDDEAITKGLAQPQPQEDSGGRTEMSSQEIATKSSIAPIGDLVNHQPATNPKLRTNSESKEKCQICRYGTLYQSKEHGLVCYHCSLKQENEDLKRHLDNQLKYTEELKTQSSRDRRHSKNKIHNLSNDLQSQISNYQLLKNDLQKCEAEISKFQKAEMAMNRKGDVLTDDEARQSLHQIFFVEIKKISRINKTFRKVPWGNVCNGVRSVEDTLQKSLAPPWVSGQWEEAVQGSTDLNGVALVDALLSNTVMTLFFKDSFFQCEPALKESLRSIYSQGIEKDAANVEKWRAQTVALINNIYLIGTNSSTSQSAYLMEISSSITRSLKTFYEVFSNLTGAEVTDLERKVEDLVYASVRLARDWHSRPFRTEVIDNDWLRSRTINWHSPDSQRYVQVFPNNKELEKGRTYSIIAVIFPGVIRVEGERGSTSEKEIVWEKASVLLGDCFKQDEKK